MPHDKDHRNRRSAAGAGSSPAHASARRPKRAGSILDPGIAKVDPKWRLMVQVAWIARQWRTLLDQRLRAIGQNTARMEALATIAFSPPESTQVEIANRIGLERATITRMFASLEEDGLVTRLSDPSDRRTKWIRLTPAGEAALAEILPIVAEMRSRLLDSTDASALDQTNGFLWELLTRLDAGLADPEDDSDAHD